MPDLSSFDTTQKAEAGVVMPLLNPIDDTPLVDEKSNEPVTITLLGRDSKIFRQAIRENSNRQLKKMTMKRKRASGLSAEELEETALELLVKMTIGWNHVELNGEVLECTPANVKQVYEKFPWIREQVDEFTQDTANFLGN